MDNKRLEELRKNINKISKTTSERIMQKEISISQKKKKHYVSKKVSAEKMAIHNIFKDRVGKYYGLTKEETLAEFLGKSLKAILQLKDREKEWRKLHHRMKALRKDGMIIIISDIVSQGTILKDIKNGQWGDRTVTSKNQYVYFRPELDEAYAFRGKMDKIILGVDETGNQTVKVTQEDLKERKVKQVIKNEN